MSQFNSIKRVILAYIFIFLSPVYGLEKTSEFDLDEITISDLQNLMSTGKITSKQLVENYLKRIDEIDGKLNSIIELNPDALEIAIQMDKERTQGNVRSVMHGVPFVIKDNIETADKMKTTAGSLALINAPTPKNDAFIVKKLRESGAILLGKTNLSEWANFRSESSSSGWSARGGQTHNPYILDRSPCGSSSGSAVAVSANLITVSVGTETDGSIICPSSINGIVGIKPTLGLVSRNGIIPLAHSQDTAGPMARTVSDAVIMLQIMVAKDDNDLINVSKDREIDFTIDYTKSLDKDGLKGARIGVARQYFGRNDKLDRLMERQLKLMQESGAILVDVEFPDLNNFGDAEYEVLLYEFKHDLNKYLKSRGGEFDSLEKLIQFNTDNAVKEMPYFDQSIFIKALSKGTLNDEKYLKSLNKSKYLSQDKSIDLIINENSLDALVAPSNTPSWMIDLIYGDSFGEFVSSSSLAAVSGYASITVPSGFINEMPIGLSFIGKAYSETTLIKIAYAWEQVSKARIKPQLLETYK